MPPTILAYCNVLNNPIIRNIHQSEYGNVITGKYLIPANANLIYYLSVIRGAGALHIYESTIDEYQSGVRCLPYVDASDTERETWDFVRDWDFLL